MAAISGDRTALPARPIETSGGLASLVGGTITEATYGHEEGAELVVITMENGVYLWVETRDPVHSELAVKVAGRVIEPAWADP